MDWGRNLIARTLYDGDLTTVIDQRVKAEFFDDDESRVVYQWMLDFYNRYGTTPSVTVTRHNWPGYKLPKAIDPIQVYIDGLRGAHTYARVVDMLQDSAAAVRDDEGDLGLVAGEALTIVRSSLLEIDTEVAPLRDHDLTMSWQSRLEEYEDLENLLDGMRGIPTGFHSIDYITSGFQDEQLITLIGLPKSGKSVTLMRMAVAAHEFGKVPLFISFEMSAAEQAARHDAMRAHISHARLTRGQLKEAERVKLRRMLKQVANMQPFIISADVSSATTVSGINAKVQQYKPDIVFVDGVYLMDDESGHEKNSPMALTAITRGLKRMGQLRGLAVVCTTQALEWKVRRNKGRQITADTIGYCVDTDTEILTDKGWKKYDEISVGDIALTLNHDLGVSEWARIDGVHVFFPPNGGREMVIMEGKSHSSLSTVNHRWPVARRTREGLVPAWTTSGDFRWNDYMILAAPHGELPEVSTYSDALVELVGWFWTEGHLIGGHGNVGITQSYRVNGDNVLRIRQALRSVFGRELNAGDVASRDGRPKWREYQERRGLSEFWLNVEAGRVLLSLAPNKVVSYDFLRKLTQAQLDLFIKVSMLADNAGPSLLTQKSRDRAERFEFACILAGIPTAMRERPPTSSTPYSMWGVRMKSRKYVTPAASAAQGRQFVIERTQGFDGVVWCPTTRNATWLARRKGSVYYTGNTSSFAQDSDVVLGLEVPPDDPEVSKLRVLLARNAPSHVTMIRYSWETGEFEEFSEDANEEADQDDFDI